MIENWQHPHQGNPFTNCIQCGMPFGARQHTYRVNGESWPIGFTGHIHVRTPDDPEQWTAVSDIRPGDDYIYSSNDVAVVVTWGCQVHH